jgi:hypothetical protein
VPFGGASLWCVAQVGDQVDGALAYAGRRFTRFLPGPHPFATSSAPIVAFEIGCGSTRSDIDRSSARACRSRRYDRDRLYLAILRPREDQLQKKCCHRRRTGPTSRAEGQAGDTVRLAVSSLSTRPGPRPTWFALMAGGHGDSACTARPRTAIGKRSRSWRLCGTIGCYAPGVLDGPINGVSFRAYVEQFLVPTLKPGRHRCYGQSRQP